MKKIFVLTLILSVFCTAQAGYVIRGINTFAKPHSLQNYTLTVDSNGPVSASSMYTAWGSNTGRNTIAIISEAVGIPVTCFPILSSVPDERFYIEVRDFHYLSNINRYVLCGSRGTDLYSRAFVAVIDGGLTAMRYYEYSEAEVFYSIWAENSASPSVSDYFVCGRSITRGVIASIDRSNLHLTNFYTTTAAQNWEYHKIIFSGTQDMPRFVVSGKELGNTQIGFTVIDPSFNIIGSYRWNQMTNPLSHCVVSDDVLVNNAVILASSYGNTVTLNPVTYPIPSAIQIPAYRYSFPSNDRYSVQDIGTQLTSSSLRISVAGFRSSPTQTVAWHGYVVGLSTTIRMRNKDYSMPFIGNYEHYKIRYDQQNEYTGGQYQGNNGMYALFGTPLKPADDCEKNYQSNYPEPDNLTWVSFSLSGNPFSDPYVDNLEPHPYILVRDECGEFKGGDPVLKSVMPAENESEIATSYDRITLKDVPASTGYQIYTIQGQLVQTGTTNPDISTASLSKGVYILRLESGKTFKFVK